LFNNINNSIFFWGVKLWNTEW